eukprot:8165928-Pyramimonas_sp.AAC.2
MHIWVTFGGSGVRARRASDRGSAPVGRVHSQRGRRGRDPLQPARASHLQTREADHAGVTRPAQGAPGGHTARGGDLHVAHSSGRGRGGVRHGGVPHV